MKIFLTGVLLLALSFANAQTTAFGGSKDLKAGIAMDFQRDNTLGTAAVVDYGIDRTFSIGFQVAYLFNVKDYYDQMPQSKDRYDAKVRFNASLGKELRLPDTMDFYPGLDVGLRDVGGHVGLKYYLDNGIGLFSEAQFVIQKYNASTDHFNALNNQFAVLLGLSFDLHHVGY